MYSRQHIDSAIAENLSLAQQWEDYAYELALQGASREDIDICCDEAKLHWEWLDTWQEYDYWVVRWQEYDYFLSGQDFLSEQELEQATLTYEELESLQESDTADYDMLVDFLYDCYKLTKDGMADYPAYV